MDLSVGLTGKVAVVTGGGGVLCAQMAKALASQGARIAVLDINEQAAQGIAAEIVTAGGDAVGLAANVVNRPSLLAAREAVLTAFGSIDILINGAGGNSPKATTSEERSFFELAQADMQFVFDLNFFGTVLPTQVFGEVMAAKGAGVVINVSSMAAFTPLTRTIAYSAAKAAVSNFTQWMAVHFAHHYSSKLRVNAIAPGFLLTEQNRFLLTDKLTGQLTPRGQKIIDATPAGRFGEADELIGAVLFLCSDASSFISGAVIPIDGAFSAYSGV
ncbi:MAG: putative oxidoreductase [Firmicutes bacterium]|nr:putative oxidoreductase [candidate division NPL-UPA2 bacterium]